MNLLIGSRALNFWDDSHKIKDTTDWDVISDHQIEGTEFHDRKFLNNAVMENYATDRTVIFNNQTFNVVSPVGLAIIKRSHLWRDLSFDKHITHYHKHLVKYRAKFTKEDERVLNDRIFLTRQEFPQGNPKLNQSVTDFFDDAVTKKYNHDYLHEIVAFYDKPLYTRLQHDASSAWCKGDLWSLLSHEDKCKCVAEETFVIAIERFTIPNSWKYAEKLAYIKSLNKVCTTLCSGWFRDFAIDNYAEIIELYTKEKFQHVKTILKE